MTEIYGMVAGYHHGNQEQDCSRPCLFLENGRCRVKSDAKCLEVKTERPSVAWAREALLMHDNSNKPWKSWEHDLIRNGANDDAVSRITGRGLNGVIKKRENMRLQAGKICLEDFLEKAREVANGR